MIQHEKDHRHRDPQIIPTYMHEEDSCNKTEALAVSNLQIQEGVSLE